MEGYRKEGRKEGKGGRSQVMEGYQKEGRKEVYGFI